MPLINFSDFCWGVRNWTRLLVENPSKKRKLNINCAKITVGTRTLATLGDKNARIPTHYFHTAWSGILRRGFITSSNPMLNTKLESMPSKSNLRKRVGIWFVLECLVIIVHYLHTYFLPKFITFLHVFQLVIRFNKYWIFEALVLRNLLLLRFD
jgi:hypothetical protein